MYLIASLSASLINEYILLMPSDGSEQACKILPLMFGLSVDLKYVISRSFKLLSLTRMLLRLSCSSDVQITVVTRLLSWLEISSNFLKISSSFLIISNLRVNLIKFEGKFNYTPIVS